MSAYVAQLSKDYKGHLQPFILRTALWSKRLLMHILSRCERLQRAPSACSLIEVCLEPGFIVGKLDQWRGNFLIFSYFIFNS